jgi:hypothetical protein
MTTALIPCDPDAIDSGYGILRSDSGALVSVPWGRRCRGLSRWNQAVICTAWNAALAAWRAVRPHVQPGASLRSCAALLAAGGLVLVAALAVPETLAGIGSLTLVALGAAWWAAAPRRVAR